MSILENPSAIRTEPRCSLSAAMADAPRARNEDPAPYRADPAPVLSDDDCIARALSILRSRVHAGPMIDSPRALRDFLAVQMSALDHEVFGCLFLDSQNRLIEVRDMFHGTLAQTSVYPREIVRSALALNAAAVIVYHNHPSGVPEPSRADEHLTGDLVKALRLVDVRVLDHVVVGGGLTVSFAERGLL